MDLPLRVVSATPGETAPTVLQAGTYTDGVFNIVLNGPVGADYVLLVSTNLMSRINRMIPLGSSDAA